MRIKKKLPKQGDERIVWCFTFLPYTISLPHIKGSPEKETSWFELVYIHQRYIERKEKWESIEFVDITEIDNSVKDANPDLDFTSPVFLWESLEFLNFGIVFLLIVILMFIGITLLKG